MYADLRDQHKLTDYRVAKDTGISTSTLTNWKHGRYTPKANKLKILADYFGVSLETLLYGEEDINVKNLSK
ncbi:helix-turn-helix domain-containing protein [Hungatella effluvii]|uniref:helix-turn-helix domain-containing protein n=1 Tax=Hungatella effluvii TaxID=1096246 RepID=UPI001F561C69|nr:helix-turn-helix transcriptional regulator [Hungatella effluvii]